MYKYAEYAQYHYYSVLYACTQFCVIFPTCSFVQKPRKGVKFLQERGLVGSETADVAQFFYGDDRLDRVSYHLHSVINVLTICVCTIC